MKVSKLQLAMYGKATELKHEVFPTGLIKLSQAGSQIGSAIAAGRRMGKTAMATRWLDEENKKLMTNSNGTTATIKKLDCNWDDFDLLTSELQNRISERELNKQYMCNFDECSTFKGADLLKLQNQTTPTNSENPVKHSPFI